MYLKIIMGMDTVKEDVVFGTVLGRPLGWVSDLLQSLAYYLKDRSGRAYLADFEALLSRLEALQDSAQNQDVIKISEEISTLLRKHKGTVPLKLSRAVESMSIISGAFSDLFKYGARKRVASYSDFQKELLNLSKLEGLIPKIDELVEQINANACSKKDVFDFITRTVVEEIGFERCILLTRETQKGEDYFVLSSTAANEKFFSQATQLKMVDLGSIVLLPKAVINKSEFGWFKLTQVPANIKHAGLMFGRACQEGKAYLINDMLHPKGLTLDSLDQIYSYIAKTHSAAGVPLLYKDQQSQGAIVTTFKNMQHRDVIWGMRSLQVFGGIGAILNKHSSEDDEQIISGEDKLEIAKMLNRFILSRLEHIKEKLEQEIVLNQEKSDELNRAQTTNSVTGLPNEIQLDKDMTQVANRQVVFIDLRGYSTLNSTYRKKIGDQALLNFIDLLNQSIPSDYKIYNRRSAEKLVLVKNLPANVIDISVERDLLIKSLLDVINRHARSFEGIPCNLKPVFGMHFEDGDVALIDKAELASIEAFNTGEVYQLYSEDIGAKQRKNIEMVANIEDALAEGRIIPYFQAIVDNTIPGDKVVKYECLARMRSEQGMLIPPGEFIHYAELGGGEVMKKITRSLIQKCFEFFKDKAGISFSINLAEVDLNDDSLFDFIISIKNAYELSPERVTFEILEGASQSELPIINELQNAGFQIAIDDFGVKNSNYERLLHIRPDYLKIDGSFIKNIRDPLSYAIVENMVRLAGILNAKVIAEFVSDKEISDQVKKLNIHYSQGYLYGKPESPEKISKNWGF